MKRYGRYRRYERSSVPRAWPELQRRRCRSDAAGARGEAGDVRRMGSVVSRASDIVGGGGT